MGACRHCARFLKSNRSNRVTDVFSSLVRAALSAATLQSPNAKKQATNARDALLRELIATERTYAARLALLARIARRAALEPSLHSAVFGELAGVQQCATALLDLLDERDDNNNNNNNINNNNNNDNNNQRSGDESSDNESSDDDNETSDNENSDNESSDNDKQRAMARRPIGSARQQKCSTRALTTTHAMMAAERVPPLSVVVAAFEQLDLATPYSAYVRAYAHAVAALEAAAVDSPTLRTLITQTDVVDLLVEPVQRVSRHAMILRQLSKVQRYVERSSKLNI